MVVVDDVVVQQRALHFLAGRAAAIYWLYIFLFSLFLAFFVFLFYFEVFMKCLSVGQVLPKV